jgi:ribosomal protein L11 methyltransferase
VENAPVFVARLVADAASARRLADLLAEQLDPASVVACYEIGTDWCIEIHFAGAPYRETIQRQVAQVVGEETAAALRFEAIAPRDWVAASLAGLRPVEAGRFTIHGAHDREGLATNRIAIEIEAALAFGTGHHGTTRGCLLALDHLLKQARSSRRRRRRGTVVLDIGTGSGVLAIAAATAMRRRVLASDLDPAAVRIARGNSRRNNVGDQVMIIRADGLAGRRFDAYGPYSLVFANILLAPLKRLAGPIARRLAPGAHVILSGLLPAHANAALAIYRAHGLRLVQRIMLEGWVTLILTYTERRAPAALRNEPKPRLRAAHGPSVKPERVRPAFGPGFDVIKQWPVLFEEGFHSGHPRPIEHAIDAGREPFFDGRPIRKGSNIVQAEKAHGDRSFP